MLDFWGVIPAGLQQSALDTQNEKLAPARRPVEKETSFPTQKFQVLC